MVPGCATCPPIILEEVDGLHGRVDLMAATFRDRAPVLADVTRLLRQRAVAQIILALCAKQPKSLARLGREVALARASLVKWTRAMLKTGLAVAVARRGLVLGPSYARLRPEIWSYELKLRDWRRALYQATRYRAFSHRSFVVMPTERVASARAAAARFRLAGVGLASFDLEQGFRVLVMPRRIVPRSSLLFSLAAAEALAANA